ncbi:LysR family transcriptional regulator [Mycolicibacterium litorale]|uniref:Probable hydrogen peroxide-inducible genes activator n=1 Tax=Mycolicibacterium litorale TaxID=758802 RepID=A0AAD1IKI9_9MYCO|nr:LysR substrate-binding domain-containing protein [Mycolicibacterium litorale]MCV7415812.1 LysR family transcriptional regulator [Mycolicibacterium litorale]TDY09063.1 DNA-binding transcriptional LysR family regulator [Mycolicibacterium litorale]BBY17000.1 LysR family transcriptional regulator [Mycolicibacterium litorale]
MDVTVAHLRSFLAVAEELHFGRAAEALRVSPSSLSEHIATLERRTGRALFTRTSRSVALTDDGRRLIPLAQRAVGAMDDVLQWARSDGDRIRLRIGLSVFSPRFRAILAEAHRQFSEIVWEVRQFGFAEPYRPLLTGEVDCAVIPEAAPPPATVAATTLWTEACLLVVADSHPLAARDRVTVDDLTDQTFVGVGDASTFDHWLGDALRDAPRTLSIARNFDEVLELCAAGIGVNVAGAAAAEMYHRPGVRFVPIADLADRPTNLCVAKGRSSPALRKFIRLAVRVAHA